MQHVCEWRTHTPHPFCLVSVKVWVVKGRAQLLMNWPQTWQEWRESGRFQSLPLVYHRLRRNSLGRTRNNASITCTVRDYCKFKKAPDRNQYQNRASGQFITRAKWWNKLAACSLPTSLSQAAWAEVSWGLYYKIAISEDKYAQIKQRAYCGVPLEQCSSRMLERPECCLIPRFLKFQFVSTPGAEDTPTGDSKMNAGRVLQPLRKHSRKLRSVSVVGRHVYCNAQCRLVKCCFVLGMCCVCFPAGPPLCCRQRDSGSCDAGGLEPWVAGDKGDTLCLGERGAVSIKSTNIR